MRKLYCFADETGQDTKGKFFLVSIVLKEQDDLGDLEQKLLAIESSTKGQFLKWKKLSFETKISLLNKLSQLQELNGSIFYSVYQNSVGYTPLVSLSIAKAILSKTKGESITTVTIDGLNDKDREIVSHELKNLKIRYRKIRGLKDEQSVFLRLAHVFANFLRDFEERQKYAVETMKSLHQIVSKV